MKGEQYLKAISSLGETATANVSNPEALPLTQAVQSALEHEKEDESHNINMAATLAPIISDTIVDDKSERSSVLRGLRPAQKAKPTQKSIWLWLPLTFKEVPKKGDWDVKRLKNSVYFFS